MDIDEKYLNSNALDVFLSCRDRNIDDALEQLYNDLYRNTKGIHKRVAKNHLRVFLLNFIELLQTKPEGYVHYPRDKNYWSLHDGKFPNPYRISAKIRDIADDLIEAGLVEHWTGESDYRDRFQSRIRPLPEFVERYIKPYRLLHTPLETRKERPLVWIKVKKTDRDGNRVFVKEQRFDARKTKRIAKPRLQRIEKVLEDYNKLLGKTDITLEVNDTTQDALYNYGRKRVFRSFTCYANSDAPYSGRFYGGWWVSAKKKHRPYIQINGEGTVELDFTAQHPYMLYSWACGIPLSDAIGVKDPYTIKKPDGSKYYRGIAKDVFMVCMNGSNKSSIRRILMNGTPEKNFKDGYKYTIEHETDQGKRQDALKKMDVLGDKEAFKAFMNAFERLHKPLFESDALFGDYWGPFQSFDANICAYIIEHMIKENIPVLSIHDSFVVQERYEGTLERIMKEAYQNHVHPDIRKALPPIKPKKAPRTKEAA